MIDAPGLDEAGGRHCAGGAQALSLTGVSLSFGAVEVLRDISLEVKAGEFVCVIGPSGSGKTSLLKVLAGLWRPTAGEVRYGGTPITGPRQDLAVVFQNYTKSLLSWRTARGNVSLALEAIHYPKAERAARISELLDLVGLGQAIDKYPRELSGGMQQRLQIARCLAQNPRALLMDEPFGALDAMTRQKLQDEILGLLGRSPTSTFFVTHDLEEAIYLGDRVIGLLAHPGRVGLNLEIDLPKPRSQLKTRESEQFLNLRRQLFDFIQRAEEDPA